MKLKISAIILLMSGLLITQFQNCSNVEFSQNSKAEPPTFSLSIGQNQFLQPTAVITNKIDILFVTDTSGSLDAERGKIADNIEAFVASLPANVDYQIAVLLAHSPLSQYSGKLYKRPNHAEYVLRSSTMTSQAIRTDLREKLTSTPGDNYSDGGEEGMASLQTLLLPQNTILAQTQGFFRPGSALAVVFIADENDICATYPAGITRVPDSNKTNGVENELIAAARDCVGITAESTYAKLVALQLTNPLLVAGILYTDPVLVPAGGENEVGYGYIDVIKLNNGLAVELTGNIANGLADIGKLVTTKLTLRTNFILSHPQVSNCAQQINQGDIEVRVNNVKVPFSFVPGACEVQISAANAGAAQSVIDIIYQYKVF